MTVGIHLINANSQVTFSDNKTYWVFKKKFAIGDRMTAYSSTTALYFDSGYNGVQPPMFFVNITQSYGFRNLSRQNESGGVLGNWLISLQTPYYSTPPSGFEMYMFLPYADTTATSPTWGIKIKNSDGTKAYDSDMKILNVGGFETVNDPSGNPTCSDTSQFATSHTSSTGVADYGFTKPCFMLPEQGMYITDCLPYNDRMFASLMNYVHSSRTFYHSWYNYWASGYNYINYGSNGSPPSGEIIAVIDGADYD